MKVNRPDNLKSIYDSMLLQCEANIEPPIISKLVNNIEQSLYSNKHIYIIYADIFCGSAAVESSLINELQQQLHSTTIILEIFCYGHYISNTKELPCDILCNLEHALWTVGSAEALLNRLTRYLIFLSLKSKKANIILVVKTAQNLHQDSLDTLLKLVSKMKEEKINLFLVLVGETLLLSELIFPFPFYEYCISKPNSYRLTPIKSEVVLKPILKQFDVSLTQQSFPSAYKEGKKIYNDIQILFDIFKSVSSEVAPVFVGVPYEILLDTIYLCMRLKGRDGENKYWPTSEDWVECIGYTSYRGYIEKLVN